MVRKVLILVVVEDVLVLVHKVCRQKGSLVLILVVVEDVLVQMTREATPDEIRMVLILVVVEDVLVPFTHITYAVGSYVS